ncbi:hypothetical protein ACQCT6_03145 [Cytobacillus gottheilii]
MPKKNDNKLTYAEIEAYKMKEGSTHEFSEELADGGERNQRFDKPRYNKK